ncbi:MAG: type II secretion system protein [Clostridia bacterium]|nr:type II secretion system protein [Clostridia bacterium]
MKRTKNNKGFSLIELIISIAILGIVAVAALGFMVSGTRGFSSVSSNVSLQYKSQLAMNYIQEYVIDCNTGICFQNNTLYVIDSETVTNAETGDDEIVFNVHIFKYVSGDEAIYYMESTATYQATGEYSFTVSDPDPLTDLLTDGVSSFSVSLSGISQVSEATVSIDFFLRSRTFSGSQTIALRNLPPQVIVTPLTA